VRIEKYFEKAGHKAKKGLRLTLKKIECGTPEFMTAGAYQHPKKLCESLSHTGPESGPVTERIDSTGLGFWCFFKN
jgi:hypothetical protein